MSPAQARERIGRALLHAFAVETGLPPELVELLIELGRVTAPPQKKEVP